jgi:hypothetical protein
MGLSNNRGGAADELLDNIGPVRFIDTKERYEGRDFKIILGDPVRIVTPDGRELEQINPLPARKGKDPNDIISF